MDTDDEDNDMTRPSLGRRHPFFQRSESTLCLGCTPPDPFNTPLEEALPLADQPHLLTPNSRREELFAMPKLQQSSNVPPAVTIPVAATNLELTDNPLELPPVRLGLSRQIHIQEDLPEPELLSEIVPVLTAMDVDDTDTTKREMSDLISNNSSSTGATTHTVSSLQQNKSSESSGTTAPSKILPSLQQIKSTTDDDRIKPPKSPLPGPSRETNETEVYFKKTRHFFQKEKAEKEAERQSKAAAAQQASSQYDEPQDLSHTATNHQPQQNQQKTQLNSSVSKMDVEDGMSDSSDASSDYFHSKRRKNSEKDLKDRPPIIVTRKKVAAAIELATATVLAKSNRNSLAEYELDRTTQKHSKDGSTNSNSADFELPSEFFDLSDEETLSAAKKRKNVSSNRDGTSSPSKTVIIRAGPSVSFFFIFF